MRTRTTIDASLASLLELSPMGRAVLFVILSICLLRCQQQSDFPVPKDIGTLSDKQKINATITEIENDLFTLGIDIDLQELPIIVSDKLLNGALGLCYEGQAIVINKAHFVANPMPNPRGATWLWETLSHEIGHCYFQRTHENKIIKARDGYVFQQKNFFTSSTYNDGAELKCTYSYSPIFSSTLMSVDYPVSSIPAEMKLFYLKELVGIIEKPTFEDILEFKYLKEVSSSPTPATYPCNVDEE